MSGKRAGAFGAAEALRARLFFVSYAPLWLTFGLRSLPNELTFRRGSVAWAAVGWLMFALYWFIDGWRLVRGSTKKGKTTQNFSDVSDQGGVVAGYLATYLLPLIGVTASGLGDWLSYGVYFTVAFLIFIRSDLALVNPTLYLYGWRVYGARVAPAGPPSLVICRDRRQLEDAVMCVNLSGCFLVLDEAEIS